MVRFIDPGASTFLANLSRIQEANQQAQEQISSGKRVSTPDDAPDQISQLLTLQASLSVNTQVQTNLTNLQASANAADQTLTTALQLVDQAASLGTQGVSSLATPQTRQQLAQQVQNIFDEVVSLSQTSLGGRYLFSGDDDRSPSYQLDPSSPTGVLRLSTALNTSQFQDPNGSLNPVGLTAGQIFDARNPDDSIAPQNLFASLHALYQALTNDDTDGITSAISAVQQSATFVNTQQEFYGAQQNQITDGLKTASELSVSLTARISAIRDTDISQAAIQLTEGSTQYQAALAARSKVPTTSLFNYLS